VHPGDRREQPVGQHRLGAGVDQHERAGAVGALAAAGLEAALAEQRRLLVAGDAGHRQVEPEEGRRVGAPDLAVGRAPPRQRRPRHAEQLAQLVAPAAARRSYSSVRLALPASVTCRAPPVSRATT
jgi:hypothetical protein